MKGAVKTEKVIEKVKKIMDGNTMIAYNKNQDLIALGRFSDLYLTVKPINSAHLIGSKNKKTVLRP